MRAIIESGGAQVAIEENARVKVPKLELEIGKEVNFDKVLFVSGQDNPKFGNPYLKDASVNGEVVSHGRNDKVIIFKFKRRTKYRRKRGHKQDYTEVLIKKINI